MPKYRVKLYTGMQRVETQTTYTTTVEADTRTEAIRKVRKQRSDTVPHAAPPERATAYQV